MVVTEPVPAEQIRTAIKSRKEVEDLAVHVVAPAANVGVLEWLTGADDEAREEAEELAAQTAEAVEAKVEIEVGDRDPLVAVQDALVAFPADEIVLAGEAGAETEEALRRFGLPVSRVPGRREGTGEETGGPEALARELARGRSSQAVVVLLGVVLGIVLAAIALVLLITLLALWLA